MFVFTTAGDSGKIKPILTKFEEYCQPRKNVPFERYRFNRRVQEAGETYDQYRTSLLNIAAGCEFEKITPDEILRDRLVFGIRDNTVRERLLRKSMLTLTTTDEVCHAAELEHACSDEDGGRTCNCECHQVGGGTSDKIA